MKWKENVFIGHMQKECVSWIHANDNCFYINY